MLQQQTLDLQRSFARQVHSQRRFLYHTGKVVQYTWCHPANRGRRLQAIIRLARFQARGRVFRKPTLARLGSRSSIWAIVHRSAAAKVLYANPPDYAELRAWRKYLKSGDLFLDVGANVGTYSIWAGEIGARVISLEPAEDTFRLLQKNIALNGYDIEPVRAAAGAGGGIGRFTSGRDCVNRMDPDGTVEVPMVTIDSLVGESVVAGMKVDVEGFEIDVLRGSARALAEHRIRLLQLEWNGTSQAAVGDDRGPVAELLTDYGYRLYRPSHDGTLKPLADMGFGADVFARPDSQAAPE